MDMNMMRSIKNDKRKRKRAASHGDDRDRISKLSNDILISIISRLKLREAIATRILSTRWRYLCTKEYDTHLSFPRWSYPDDSVEDTLMIRRRFRNYVNMINQIVDSHKGSKLKKFRVRIHCLEGARASIEKWLVFAFSKQVEIIDIRMDYYFTKARGAVDYSFQLRNVIMQLPHGLGSLKKLSLFAIHVEDSEIDLLLSNSPLLESLSITFTGSLKKVVVDGQPTFMLKHLELCYLNLELLEIGNMLNLVSLKLHDLDYEFVLALNNVPKLVEYCTSDECFWPFHNFFSSVAPSIRNQLRTLKICWSDMYPPRIQDMIPEFISVVKHLELHSDPTSTCELNERLCRYLAVIQRCPTLEELVIKLSWRDNTIFQEKDATPLRRLPKGDLFPSLKRIKFSGFVGSSTELNLYISILNNANSLEELTVQVCDVTEEIHLLATARAWQRIRPAIHGSTTLQVI